MAVARATIPYQPRWYQLEVHQASRRFNVLVFHRRAGKTVGVVNELIRDAVLCQLDRPHVAYIAPLYRQAKRVAWDYVKHYTRPIPGMQYLEGELAALFPNGARFSLFGADNPDSLRGMYFDSVALDEVAQMAPRTWFEVVRPALADRGGRATFIGTPMGRLNLFHELLEHARESQDPDWYWRILTVDDTGIIPDKELNDARKMMRDDEFRQEFMCDFSASVRGAYWAKEMAAMEREGRVGTVPHDPSLPVLTSWDLGWADLLVCVHWQVSPGRVAAIACDAYTHTSIPDAIADIRKKRPSYNWTHHYGPHDKAVHEQGTGYKREDIARAHGWRFEDCPAVGRDTGIEQVRLMLPRTYMDAQECKVLIEALRLYRSEYDEVRRVQSKTPVHDWTSHYADAVRYFATTQASRVAPQFDMWNEDPGMLVDLERRYGRAAM